MPALRWKLLPVALLVALWGALRPPATPAVAGAVDGPSEESPAASAPVDTTLAELRADPSDWLGRRVRFALQFQALTETWNPGLTRFGPADWVAFSGWADERFVWDRSVFDSPATRLFVQRGDPLQALFEEARTYERFELVAEVREVLFGEPWIEIVEARPLFELVGEGTILHVGRAHEFARRKQWDLALQQFERAASAPLPAHARTELERQIERCVQLREASAPRD